MTEQARNPYAPSRVPLNLETSPVAKHTDDIEYGGFWLRVAAVLIDYVFLIPTGIASAVGLHFSAKYNVYAFVPTLLINAFYWIYLVKRYGGTPGKRLLKMRVAMENSAPVTTTAAIVRFAPMYALTALMAFLSLQTSLGIESDNYDSLSYLAKLQVIGAAQPAWGIWASVAIWAWIIVTAIVMLCNERRRALHDFFAGTVVLREQR
jgi:uncharacterized RDD family membrane protein YckC